MKAALKVSSLGLTSVVGMVIKKVGLKAGCLASQKDLPKVELLAVMTVAWWEMIQVALLAVKMAVV